MTSSDTTTSLASICRKNKQDCHYRLTADTEDIEDMMPVTCSAPPLTDKSVEFRPARKRGCSETITDQVREGD